MAQGMSVAGSVLSEPDDVVARCTELQKRRDGLGKANEELLQRLDDARILSDTFHLIQVFDIILECVNRWAPV